MKKICHVTTVHKYDDVRILKKECVSLKKKYEVILVAPNVESGEYDGVKVCGVNLPTNRLSRIFHLNRVYDELRRVNADVYHFHDPELIRMGLLIKKRLRKKVIFDSHEDIPLDIAEKKWIPFPFRALLSYFFKYYERYAFPKYDAIISVTPTIVNKLKQLNPNTFQVTNYPIWNAVEDNRQWGNSICFAGLVSSSWMHKNIIDSIKGLNIRYKLAGPISKVYLDELKKMENWSQVDYSGVLEHQRVISFLQGSTIGMALYNYAPSFGFKTGSLGNNKIFEYMAAGIPIIATDFTLWKEIVEDQGCGICVNPYDVQAINQAISLLMTDKEKAKAMGEVGKLLVKTKYNWTSQESILLEVYRSILND